MAHHIELGSWVDLRSEPSRSGRPETTIVNRRDGTALLLDETEAVALGRGEVFDAELLSDLETRGFLAGAAAPMARPPGGRVWRFLTEFDVRWTGANLHIGALHRRGLHRVWRRTWLAVQVVMAVLGGVALVAQLHSGRGLELRLEPWEVPLYLVLSLLAIAVHELAHGLAIVRRGHKVSAVGFRLHLGSPAFYVESVEALLLPRRDRIVQAAAGPWAEWLVVSVAGCVLWLVPTGDVQAVLQRFVLLTAFTVVANLLPFAGLDGALILGDLMREPHLSRRAREAVLRLPRQFRPGDGPLVVYAIANTLVSATLLLTALWFWYELVGHHLLRLAGHSVAGFTAAAAVVVITFAPCVRRALTACRRWELADRVAFRLERRKRVRLARVFAQAAPFDQLDEHRLSVLAGQFEICSVHRMNPLHREGFRGYVAVASPVEIGGERAAVGSGVIRVDGPGLAVSSPRFGPTVVAVLPHEVSPLG